MGKQEIEQLEIGSRDMHGRAFKAEHRLVNYLKQLPHAINLARFDCQLKEFDWRLGQRLDLSLHAPSLWQTIEYAAYSVVHLISNQSSFYNRQLPEAFDSKRTSASLLRRPWQSLLYYLYGKALCSISNLYALRSTFGTNKRQR